MMKLCGKHFIGEPIFTFLKNLIGLERFFVLKKDSKISLLNELVMIEGSQKALAEKLGVSENVISNIKNNVSTPNVDFIIGLNELYLISPSFLLLGEITQKEETIKTAFNVSKQTAREYISRLGVFLKAMDCKQQDLENEYDENITIFASRLKEIRKYKKLTLKEISNKLHYSLSSVQRFENSKSTPREEYIEYVINFCKVLDVSLDYILLGVSLSFDNSLKAVLECYDYGTQQMIVNYLYSLSVKKEDL